MPKETDNGRNFKPRAQLLTTVFKFDRAFLAAADGPLTFVPLYAVRILVVCYQGSSEGIRGPSTQLGQHLLIRKRGLPTNAKRRGRHRESLLCRGGTLIGSCARLLQFFVACVQHILGTKKKLNSATALIRVLLASCLEAVLITIAMMTHSL